MRRRRLHLSRLLPALMLPGLLCAAGGALADDEKEWSRRYDLYLPGTQPMEKGNMRGVVLVRDAVTGKPIQGARLRMFTEDLGELTLTAPLQSEVRTDEYGIANSPGDTYDFQSLVLAAGYAPQGHYGGGFDWIASLERGVTAQGRLIDTTGRPYVGTPVEYYLGCPHSPAAQSAITDAHGRFTWTHADPEGQVWYPYRLHVSGPNVADYWAAREEPATTVVDRGWTATGRVVDSGGKPVRGCVVRTRSRESSRGPAVATAEDGRFSLSGVDPDAPLYFYYRNHDDGATPFHTTSAWHRSVPLRVTLGGAQKREKRHPLTVNLGRAKEILLVRASDGLGVRGREDLAVPEGRYRCFAGRPFELYEHVPVEAYLPPADGSSLIRFQGAICPTLRIELDDRKRYEGFHDAVLWCDGYQLDVSLLEPGLVHVPAERPVHLVVSDGMIKRVYPLEALEKNQRRVRIEWPQPTRVHLPVETDYVIADGSVQLVPEETRTQEDGRTTWLTYATGPIRLQLETGAGPVDLALHLPETVGGEVHVRPEALKAHVPVRFDLLLPDGTPASGARLNAYDPRPGDLGFGDVDEAGADGRCTIRCQAGAPFAFAAQLEGYLELRGTLAGTGPHELRWPQGVLEITVTGKDARPLPFGLWLDARFYDPDEARPLVLRGVEPGMRTLIVGARGHFGQVMRVKIGADAPRKLEVQLEPR